MPMISVIVPVYKVEPYICRCVDSILNQTDGDFELILVDDGSPDNCGRICDEYAEKDSRIHVIHQPNGGLSAARNAGIDWVFANSDSQWITFVDSDDWIHSRYLEYLLHAANVHQCQISACHAFCTGGEAIPEPGCYDVVCASADDYYCGALSANVGSTAWCKLYAKELFETLRYPVGKLHEDEFTTYKAVYAAGKVAVVPAAMYAYYQNPEGIIRSKWNPRRMDAIQALEEQMAFAEETGNACLKAYSFDVYTWFLLENLHQIRKQECMTEDILQCRKDLQKRLRSVLHKGANRKKYPLNGGNLWAYEEAYPAVLLWGSLRMAARTVRRMFRK